MKTNITNTSKEHEILRYDELFMDLSGKYILSFGIIQISLNTNLTRRKIHTLHQEWKCQRVLEYVINKLILRTQADDNHSLQEIHHAF